MCAWCGQRPAQDHLHQQRTGGSEEELEVGYKGEALDIGFNITYLLDVLHNLAADQVVLALGDANSSALITMRERNDYKYVVMPMRI